MTAIKITKRIVDPITFSERVSLEFIPRLEDYILDETIGNSYKPPNPKPFQAAPPNSEQITKTANIVPQGVQTGGLMSPRRMSPKVSPRMRKSSPIKVSMKSLSKKSLAQILEHKEPENDGSITDLSSGEKSIQVENFVGTGIRFADDVEVNEISRLRDSIITDMFYGSEDLAEFRYEAFMEEAGLDIADYDWFEECEETNTKEVPASRGILIVMSIFHFFVKGWLIYVARDFSA